MLLWKPIKDFHGYKVSNYGEVFSQKTNKYLKPWKLRSGHLSVMLYKNKKYYMKYIHRLVLKHFVSCCPKGYECNHIDGKPNNNTLNNLEWVTHAENLQHASKLGLLSINKLNINEVKQIKNLLINTNLTHKNIAKLFKISRSTITDINNNRSWRHI